MRKPPSFYNRLLGGIVDYSSSDDDDDELPARNATEMPAPVEMPAPSVALPMTEEAQVAEEASGVSTPSKPLPAPMFAAMFSKVGASMSPGHSRDQANDTAARVRLKAQRVEKERLATQKQQEAAATLRKRSLLKDIDLTDTPGPESPAMMSIVFYYAHGRGTHTSGVFTYPVYSLRQ